MDLRLSRASLGIAVSAAVLLAGTLTAVVWLRHTAPPPPAPPPVSEERPREAAPPQRIRPAAVAGSWYPADPSALGEAVDGFLGEGRADCDHLPAALVAPHAGYAYSGPTAGRTFAEVAGCEVRRVWVLGPTHHRAIDGAAVFRVDAFRTPLGDLPVDAAVARRLVRHPGLAWLQGDDGGEHSLEMQLPLLQRALGSFELVPILVGSVDVQSAAAIAAAIRAELGPGDLVVISSDFTHHGERFGYTPFRDRLPERLDELDHQVWAHVAAPDPIALAETLVRTRATVCGRNPLQILAALVGPDAEGRELSYATSGALTGDWGNTVSYLAGRVDRAAWSGRGPEAGSAELVSPETGTALLALARETLERWYATQTVPEVDPKAIPADAHGAFGAFVTLEERDGTLRGCIGSIVARGALWQEVVTRALDAALRDSRFPPVEAAELPGLRLDVTVLGPSHAVSGPREIISGRHGVILSLGRRSATFLPQVAADRRWPRQTQLAHLARKAGVPASSIAQARLEVYDAQVFREP